MEFSYEVRFCQSPRPRVMRLYGQPSSRSVHRGKSGQCIELQKQFFEDADLVLTRGRQHGCRTSKASPGQFNALRPLFLSINLANSVQAAVTAVVGRSNRGVRQSNFVVIRPTLHYQSTAACLVEVSFLCDAAEETNLSNATYRQRIAQAIADGVIEFNDERNFRERESKCQD